MAKYQRKDLIEAIKLLPETTSTEIHLFLGEDRNFPECVNGGIDPSDGKLKLHTPSGPVTVNVGDYLIRFHQYDGRGYYFTASRADIFERIHELVEE